MSDRAGTGVMGWVKGFVPGRGKGVATPAPSPAPAAREREPLERIARSPVHPVYSGAELLAYLPRWPEIEDRIFRFSQLTIEQFRALYLAPIEAFAERVQFLPASETHHHAGPLGQLEHTLEVIENALAERRGHVLPLGAEPERVAKERPVWTYGVFVGALGHDAAKPGVNFVIEADLPKLGWRKVSLLAESLYTMGATQYRFSWVRQRDYELHVRCASLMMGRLLPAGGIAWLSGFSEVLSQVFAYLAGDPYACGIIGELCQRADGTSVARNVGFAAPGSTASVGGVEMPMTQRAITMLRELAQAWTLNGRATNTGTVTGGSDAWVVGGYIFVRSTVMNDLHSKLAEAGVKGLPESPPALITKLSDLSIAMSFREGDGKLRSVFSIRITSEDGHVVHPGFTVLVFPLERVFGAVVNRPVAFDGTIEIVKPSLPENHALVLAVRPPHKPAPLAQQRSPAPSAPRASGAVAPVDEAPLDADAPQSPAEVPEPAVPVRRPKAQPSTPAPVPAAPAVPSPATGPTSEAAALDFLRLAGMGQQAPSGAEAEPAPPADAADPRPEPDLEVDVPAADPPGPTDALEPDDVAGDDGGVDGLRDQESADEIPSAASKAHLVNDVGDYLPSAHAGVEPKIVRAFFAWLREGLGAGPESKVPQLLLNKRGALVHCVQDIPQGVGVVTPKAFRDFLAAAPYTFEDGEFETADGFDAVGSNADERQLQNAIRGSRWAVHNGQTPGMNVFTYLIDAGQDQPSGMSLIVLGHDACDLILPAGVRFEANKTLRRTTADELVQMKAAFKSTKQPQGPRGLPQPGEKLAVKRESGEARAQRPKKPQHAPKKRPQTAAELLGLSDD